MLFSRADCLKQFGTDYKIKKQIENGKLFQIDRSLYSDQPHVPELAVASFRYPKGIVTMNTAFYYYNLTDVIPSQVDLATDRDAAKIKDANIRQYFMPHFFFENGAVTHTEQGYSFRIYNRERLLIELLRARSVLPYDFYKEVLQSYRKLIPSLDMRLIEDYVLSCPKSKSVLRALETEVL